MVGMSESDKKLAGIHAEFEARRLLLSPELESLLASVATNLAQLQIVARKFMAVNEHKVRLSREDNGYALQVVTSRTTERDTRATIIFEMDTVTTDEAIIN